MLPAVKKILEIGKVHLKYQILVVCLGFFSIALTAFVPFLLKELLDGITAGTMITLHLGLLVILIVAFYTFSLIVLWMGGYVSNYAERKAGAWLQQKLFAKALSLTPSYYARSTSGELLATATSDVEVIGRMGMSFFPAMVIETLSLAVAAIILMTLSMYLGIIALATLPLYYFSMKVFEKRLQESSLREREEYGHGVEMLRETAEGVRTIQIYDKLEYFKNRFDSVLSRWLKAVSRTAFYQTTNYSVQMYLTTMCPLIILGLGAVMANINLVTIGTVVASFMFLSNLYRPIERFAFLWNQLQRAIPIADRAFKLLDEAEIRRRRGKPFPTSTDFTFRNVSFRYDGNYVLQNLNLSVEDKQHLAIVGGSGAGKSTLVFLLLELYEPSDGEIHLSGNNIEIYDSCELRRNIAYVSSNAFLFNMSIKENITMGDTFSDEEVKRVMATCQIDELDPNLLVGERGCLLSDGQKQRIALARALARKPKILILDEATSAVDSKIENAICTSIKNMECTTIIISHRLSTILTADSIAVLQNHQIAATGTHEQLISNCREYIELFEKQVII